MPTLGLKPSRSSIIKPQIPELNSLLHRRCARHASLAFPHAIAERGACDLMKASQFFISTLKEAPADAEVASHQLMMRAGLIKRLGAGIYSYMPMGLRVIRKVEAIIREEMNRAGAVELLMPVVQPAELWQESGPLRQDRARAAAREGSARARLHHPAHQRRGHHRHRAPGAAQLPAAAEEFLSHPDQVPRRAPAALRRDARARVHDEGRLLVRPRPRVGEAQLRRDVRRLLRASSTAWACTYRAVAADTGAIGGDLSHEFQVIADTGEDAIVYCPSSTTRPTSSWPRRWRRSAPRAAPAAGAGEDADARQEHLRGRGRAARLAARAHGEVAGAGHRHKNEAGDVDRQPRLAAAGARRPRPERGQGRQAAGAEGRLPLRHRRRDRGTLRYAAGLPRPDRLRKPGEGRRRPHGGRA